MTTAFMNEYIASAFQSLHSSTHLPNSPSTLKMDKAPNPFQLNDIHNALIDVRKRF